MSDPQSFIGWFRDVPALAAPHHPYRLGLLLVDRARPRRLPPHRLPLARPSHRSRAGQHYAPGTIAEPVGPGLPARSRGPCDGVYWFRLFQRPYWNTTRLPNGRYLLVVRAWDAAGNRARKDVEIRIANPPL